MSEELQENAEAQTEEVQAGESEQPQEVTQERPDWLPEKFERPEELANSYQDVLFTHAKKNYAIKLLVNSMRKLPAVRLLALLTMN